MYHARVCARVFVGFPPETVYTLVLLLLFFFCCYCICHLFERGFCVISLNISVRQTSTGQKKKTRTVTTTGDALFSENRTVKRKASALLSFQSDKSKCVEWTKQAKQREKRQSKSQYVCVCLYLWEEVHS